MSEAKRATPRDIPILMSAPMVRATLSDAKTQTRRILKPQPRGTPWFWEGDEVDPEPKWFDWWEEGREPCGAPTREVNAPIRLRWAVGDRLWVRETLTARPMANFLTGEPTNAIVAAYAADDEDVVERAGFNLCPWWNGGADKRRSLPAIHMPRRVSRITLEVTGIKIERLQGISEADAIAEGVEYRDGSWGIWDAAGSHVCGGSPDPREAYRCLWLNINGPGSWDANPWVVAIEYRRVVTIEGHAEPVLEIANAR